MASKPVVHVIDDDDAARDSLAFLPGTAQFASRSGRLPRGDVGKRVPQDPNEEPPRNC
jgi:hypothetical protein